MNTNIKKKGRIAMAWLIIITMVFATMSTPFALADTAPVPTTPGVTIFGFEKVNEGDIEDETVGIEADFILFKQASVQQESYYLWTKEEIPDSLKADIYAYLQFNDPSLANYPFASLNFIWGFDGDAETFNDSPYGITLSEDGDFIVIDWEMGKISHIDFGQYEFEAEAEGTGAVVVNKVLTGPMDLEADMFDFTIVETDDEWETLLEGYTETVSNDAAGNIPFSAIKYEKAGTYYYVISEVVPVDKIEGVTYDQHMVKVTMTVADVGDGILEGTPAYDGVTTFTNDSVLYGSIEVTKEVVVLGDDPEATVNYTFYAALFEDVEGTMVKVSDVKPLVVVDKASTSVTFDGLDLEKTYYVFETDAEGNIIATDANGKIETPIIPAWIEINYEDAVVTLSAKNLEGESTITNVFNTEGFPLFGSITVNKTVTANGKAFASNRTFYVALFADKELTELVSDVNALKMNGKSSTTTEFLTDIDGNPLEAGTTYYIAETDKDGVPLTGSYKELGFEISIDNAKIVITEEGTTVNIINKFKSEEFPLTGDNSNMNLWLFLAMLGVAGAIAPFAFRKKEVAND